MQIVMCCMRFAGASKQRILIHHTTLPPFDAVPGECTGVRHGGTVYIYSMFGDEVIVPMFDLHFRSLHVRGFWVSEWLSTLTRTQRQAALQVPCQSLLAGLCCCANLNISRFLTSEAAAGRAAY